MTDSEERAYERGFRQAWRGLLGRALGELAAPSPSEHPEDVNRVRLGALEAERHDTVNALRDLCREHNLSDKWDDDLHLGDVVEKHVNRSLAHQRELWACEIRSWQSDISTTARKALLKRLEEL